MTIREALRYKNRRQEEGHPDRRGFLGQRKTLTVIECRYKGENPVKSDGINNQIQVMISATEITEGTENNDKITQQPYDTAFAA